MLTYNPLHRISAAEALIHPYFTAAADGDVEEMDA